MFRTSLAHISFVKRYIAFGTKKGPGNCTIFLKKQYDHFNFFFIVQQQTLTNSDPPLSLIIDIMLLHLMMLKVDSLVIAFVEIFLEKKNNYEINYVFNASLKNFIGDFSCLLD